MARAERGGGVKAPFPWFGGKRRVASDVWAALGPVDNYVEPFAGSLAVLLARPDEPKTETVNDMDCYLSKAAIGSKTVNDANRHNERLWYSPACEQERRLL